MKLIYEAETKVLEDEPVDLQVEVEYSAVCEHGYGADADGNRGTTAWWLDEFKVKLFYEGQDITDQFEKDHPKEFERILDEANEAAIAEAQDADYDDHYDADRYPRHYDDPSEDEED